MNTPVNPYQAPKASVGDIHDGLNTSGGGKDAVIPEGVKGWSWGAFLLNWIWAIGNKTWIGLLALVPYIGFIVAIYLGIKGRELAWRNKEWDDLEHFNRIQKRWSAWGVGLIIVPALIGILAAILIPMFNS
ncbi:hypothetical protein [Uliginosibacterium aquaticum]|uniref:hypothetical protein n=1 Tax=Uliginosibacterium aquaticum TaxID=2731212 RepID=UPI001C2D4C3A|nr:hypothetical protein [Uliginosibacterium aquaticum]